ncbi:MAG TPA: HAD family hydrolase, partial [Clostridia bacterium]|nr:HAD family hydrolase [Clostridia bacterium]
MRTRVIIFDIYNTLLQVGAAPPDAEVRWLRLCRSLGKETTVLSLAEFDAKCREAIARDHAAAKARGVAFPEVFWPEITCTVLPQLKGLSPDSLDDFLYEHAQLQRTVQLMPGAGEALRTLHQQGTVLGLCSNSQPYTLRELAQALAQVRLTMEIFDPRLCFYSFRAGFSKPNLKAFEQLQQVLTGLSVSPVEV